MQDFTKFDYVITIPELEKAAEIVGNITVIINGEYYDLVTGEKKEEKV